MIQALSRFTFIAAGLLAGWLITQTVDWQIQYGLSPQYVIFVFVILGGAIGYVLGGIVGRELATAWRLAETRVSGLAGVDVLLGTIGLVVGLLIAFLAAQPLRLLEPAGLAFTLTVLLSLLGAYVGIGIALTRRRDAVALFPALAPGDATEGGQRTVLLDTSAVIDGRFTEFAQLGFMPGRLRVPRFVLSELQTLADSADDTRRARGRRGLDLLSALPDDNLVDVFEVDYSELSAVDDKLMRLSVDAGATLATVDYNLTKVARVRGIEVLNLNEAAAALRPSFLPGDPMRLRVVKPGKEQGQGVGYLEDGTMVVIQDARDRVGTDASVEVTTVLQTAAGRMIFARPLGNDELHDAEDPAL
jgi:uncharacterized protein YacL